ncbi:MAG: retropepsin-like aspartic protease family protein [Noviherbaspirillum sp.]
MRGYPWLVAALLCVSQAQASEIGVVGLFPGKAVLVVDGAAPRTYAAGARVAPDVRLISVDSGAATLEIKGRREVIAIGGHVNRQAPGGRQQATLQANTQGHFITQGQINGGSMTMLVDTGATLIALSAADAVRLGIDYRKGRRGMIATANGQVPVYRVRLDTVRVGEIELTQVDATVQEQSLPFALLGMSFLNRTEMRRDGQHMTLTKRY